MTHRHVGSWRKRWGAQCRGRAESNTESYAPELNAASPVGTARSVYASLRKHEALYWSAADKVRLNDFFNIFHLDEAVPDRLGIDDNRRPMLTLIETPRLVDPDCCLQPFELTPRLKGLADGE